VAESDALWISSATIDANDHYVLLGINGGTNPYLLRIYKDGSLHYASELVLTGYEITAIDTYSYNMGVELTNGSENRFLFASFSGFIDLDADTIPDGY